MEQRSFSFDAGRISLDLLATLGDRRHERIPDTRALAEWLHASGLATGPIAVEARELARARDLRAALFGVVDSALRGVQPAVADVEAINAAAAVPAQERLAYRSGGFVRERSTTTIAEALGVIARDAVELLSGPERELLRECAADDCSGIYVDASRGRTRRWCSARRCGNRARVAAHRRRRASDTGPPVS